MADSPPLSIWNQPTDSGMFSDLHDPLRQKQAIDRILTHYAPALTELGRKLGLRPDDVDELRQHVVADLLPALPSFRYKPRKGGFRNYLRRCWFRAKGKHDRFLKQSLPWCGYELEGLVEVCTRPDNVAIFLRRAEAKHDLLQAWDLVEGRLGDRDRELFIRVVWHGENRDQVARELDMTRANADQVISRTRRWLKEALPRRTGGSEDHFLPPVPPLS